EKDLEISMTGNRLTVSGHREAEKRDESDRYYLYERSYGSFSRSFTLPDGVDNTKVAADLKDGVLTMLVPRRPETQPRKINVRSNG
ncbi:MAG: Hsp20 family protein, partial [Myxococcaceae bacterium]